MTDKKPEIQSTSLSGDPFFLGCGKTFSSYHQLIFYRLLVLYITSIPNNLCFELSFPSPILCLGWVGRCFPTPPSETWITNGKLLLMQLISPSLWHSHMWPLQSSPQNSIPEWEKGITSYLALSFLFSSSSVPRNSPFTQLSSIFLGHSPICTTPKV